MWHLVRHDSDSQKDSERSNKLVSEIYLTRYFSHSEVTSPGAFHFHHLTSPLVTIVTIVLVEWVVVHWTVRQLPVTLPPVSLRGSVSVANSGRLVVTCSSAALWCTAESLLSWYQWHLCKPQLKRTIGHNRCRTVALNRLSLSIGSNSSCPQSRVQTMQSYSSDKVKFYLHSWKYKVAVSLFSTL